MMQLIDLGSRVLAIGAVAVAEEDDEDAQNFEQAITGFVDLDPEKVEKLFLQDIKRMPEPGQSAPETSKGQGKGKDFDNMEPEKIWKACLSAQNMLSAKSNALQACHHERRSKPSYANALKKQSAALIKTLDDTEGAFKKMYIMKQHPKGALALLKECAETIKACSDHVALIKKLPPA